MAKLLIPGEVLAITGQAADLLLRLDNGMRPCSISTCCAGGR